MMLPTRLQAIPLLSPLLSLTVRMKNQKTLKMPTIQHFCASRTITSVIQRPEKIFFPPFLSGNLTKKTNINILKSIDAKQQKKVPVSSAAAESSKPAKRLRKKNHGKRRPKHVGNQ